MPLSIFPSTRLKFYKRARVKDYRATWRARYLGSNFEYARRPNSKACATGTAGIIHRRQEMQIPFVSPRVGQCSLTLPPFFYEREFSSLQKFYLRLFFIIWSLLLYYIYKCVYYINLYIINLNCFLYFIYCFSFRYKYTHIAPFTIWSYSRNRKRYLLS